MYPDDVGEMDQRKSSLRRFRKLTAVGSWGIEGSCYRARAMELDPEDPSDRMSMSPHPYQGALKLPQSSEISTSLNRVFVGCYQLRVLRTRCTTPRC